MLGTLRQEGSILQGHPDMKKCPGIDISTGSLGQGLACGVGMGIAAKKDNRDYRVFVVVGDGECQEGEIWEAAQTAHKYELDNLVVFVDNNNLQLDGTTDEVMPNINLGDKFKAFGFDTYEIDGHDMKQIVDTLDRIRMRKNGKPKCIFANTVKGKGVSFMENQCGWHGVAPNDEQYAQAMKELDAQLKKLEVRNQHKRMEDKNMSEVKKATRDGFGEEIVKLGKLDNDIYVVDVDIGKSCKTGEFRKQLPKQYLNVA